MVMILESARGLSLLTVEAWWLPAMPFDSEDSKRTYVAGKAIVRSGVTALRTCTTVQAL